MLLLLLPSDTGSIASICSDDDMYRKFQHRYTMMAARLDTQVRWRRVRKAGPPPPPDAPPADADAPSVFDDDGDSVRGTPPLGTGGLLLLSRSCILTIALANWVDGSLAAESVRRSCPSPDCDEEEEDGGGALFMVGKKIPAVACVPSLQRGEAAIGLILSSCETTRKARGCLC